MSTHAQMNAASQPTTVQPKTRLTNRTAPALAIFRCAPIHVWDHVDDESKEEEEVEGDVHAGDFSNRDARLAAFPATLISSNMQVPRPAAVTFASPGTCGQSPVGAESRTYGALSISARMRSRFCW